MKEALDKDLYESQTPDDTDHLHEEPVSALVRTIGSLRMLRSWSLRLLGYVLLCQTDPSETEQMLDLLWNVLHQSESKTSFTFDSEFIFLYPSPEVV